MSEQAEQAPSGGGPEEALSSVCPWCSAALPDATVEQCPACGAALKEQATEVPGVTRIDPEAILRARSPVQKSRGLIGWLSGEYEAQPEEPPSTDAIEPPDAAVRREMLRLELAALEAEVQARQVEAIADAVDAGEIELGSDQGLGELATAEVVDLPEVAETPTPPVAADPAAADADAPAEETKPA